MNLIIDKPPQYRTYILRFWEERQPQSQSSTWRFTIEDSETNTRRGFRSIEELVTFLEKNVGDS